MMQFKYLTEEDYQEHFQLALEAGRLRRRVRWLKRLWLFLIMAGCLVLPTPYKAVSVGLSLFSVVPLLICLYVERKRHKVINKIIETYPVLSRYVMRD